jgi:hypothetical protein
MARICVICRRYQILQQGFGHKILRKITLLEGSLKWECTFAESVIKGRDKSVTFGIQRNISETGLVFVLRWQRVCSCVRARARVCFFRGGSRHQLSSAV